MAEHMRPFLDARWRSCEREVEAGRLREHDPVELMQLVYGAVLDVLLGRGLPRARCPARTDDARGAGALPRRAHRDAAGRARAALSRPERNGSRSITAWR